MQRRTQTLPKIKRAFIQLIHDKGMDNLTVSDIAREAQINRGTFYLHYIDKYDLMEKLEAQAITDLEELLLADQEQEGSSELADLIPYEAILQALRYVKQEFALVEALASEGGDPLFMDRMKQILSDLLVIKFNRSDNLHIRETDIPSDYVKELMLAGTISIIELWIHKGGIESPEEIARIIEHSKHFSPFEMIAVDE